MCSSSQPALPVSHTHLRHAHNSYDPPGAHSQDAVHHTPSRPSSESDCHFGPGSATLLVRKQEGGWDSSSVPDVGGGVDVVVRRLILPAGIGELSRFSYLDLSGNFGPFFNAFLDFHLIFGRKLLLRANLNERKQSSAERRWNSSEEWHKYWVASR